MRFWEMVRQWFALVDPPKVKRRYPRLACQVCGGTFALTSRGAWKHKCRVPKDAV